MDKTMDQTIDKKAMTTESETMPEKEADVKREAVKETPRQEVVPEIFFQYREYEANLEAVTDRVKAHYYAKGHAEGSIENMQIYIKPEDFTAYYVINDGVVGKVNLF